MTDKAERDRRALRWGAPALLLLLLLGRGLPAVRDWTSTERRLAEQSAWQLRRAISAHSQRSEIADSLRERTARYVALSPSLLTGATSAAASAGLVGLVTSAADAAGVHVTSTQASMDSARVFTPIAVRLVGTGDVRGITRLLASLERTEPLLSVSDVSIAQPDVGASADRMESLRVDFTVRGLALVARRSR